MKHFLFLITLFLSLSSFSQNPDKSELFVEPKNWSKLIQLKNKNTFLLEVTPKDGLNAILFNEKRKIVSNGKLTFTLIKDKLVQSTIAGIYEIGGDPVIFYNTYFERIPVLIRVIIDGKTGKVKSEEKIAEMGAITVGNAYGAAFGDTEMPSISVEKDPESEYYALAIFDSFAPDTKDRIEVVHFNPSHQIINRAKYRDPNNKYKYTNFLSLYVNKDEYVTMSTYAFNTKKSGGEDGRFFVSQLSKGKTTFVQTELEYKGFYKKSDCLFVYNKPLSRIEMILINAADSKSDDVSYDIVFQSVNPKTLVVSKPYRPDLSAARTYYKEQMKRKNEFNGMIQGCAISKTGNLVLLIQTTNLVQSSSGFQFTFLSDVAVLTISPEGKTISTNVIPIAYQRAGSHGAFSYLHVNKGIKGVPIYQGGFANEQYFHMQLFSGADSEILLANNTQENINKPDTEKPNLVKAISGCSAIKYTLKKGSVSKETLFGDAGKEKGAQFCNFSASDYNAESKTYAMLVIDPKVKMSFVSWLKME